MSEQEALSDGHVLLLPYPAQGHLNPMMHLGRAIAKTAMKKHLNIGVTLLTIKSYQQRILRSAAAAGDEGGGVAIIGVDDARWPEAVPELVTEDSMTDLTNGRSLDFVRDEIQKLADEGTPVTFIISDHIIAWASDVAQMAELPEYVFNSQNATMFNIYMHVHDIIKSGYDPVDDNVRATVFPRPEMEPVRCVPGLPPMHPADLPFDFADIKPLMLLIKKTLDIRVDKIRSGSVVGVIINSLAELESDVYSAIKAEYAPDLEVRMVGPLVPVAGDAAESASLWEAEAEECLGWLDEQPPASVIYVSFGSLTTWTVEEMHEIAWGLQSSGYRFLWVVRPNSVAGHEFHHSDEEALKAAIFPTGFWDAVGGRGMIVRWSPQAQVLCHVAVGGFLSHCGWNSTLESLAAGVPVLGRPWVNDQVTNCWMLCEYWRTGIRLPLHCLRRHDVADGVRRLMSDDDMRRRAATLSNIISSKTRDIDLEALVDDIVRHSKTQKKKMF